MRQLTILCAGLAVTFGSFNLVHAEGEVASSELKTQPPATFFTPYGWNVTISPEEWLAEYDRIAMRDVMSHWQKPVAEAPGNCHVIKTDTLYSVANNLDRSLIQVHPAPALVIPWSGMHTLHSANVTPSTVATDCQAGCCDQSCASVDCHKCAKDIDPVTIAFITKERKNSPASRFGASLESPCSPQVGAYSTIPSACPSASCSTASAPPMVVSAPVITHHLPLPSQPICAQPMPIAMSPQFFPTVHGCLEPMPCYAPPTTYYPSAMSMNCCCDSSHCTGKCAESGCGCAKSTCQCAASTCKCAAAACKCAASTCKCSNSTSPCAASTCKCGQCNCNRTCSVGVEQVGIDFEFCVEDESENDECDDVQARLEHILEASRHLALAGMNDEANELRKQCVAEVSQLARRLKAAESELARLRKSPPEAKAVNYDVTAVCPHNAEIVDAARCATACKETSCDKCKCSPCGKCEPAAHKEPAISAPSFKPAD